VFPYFYLFFDCEHQIACLHKIISIKRNSMNRIEKQHQYSILKMLIRNEQKDASLFGLCIFHELD
jgi:hypothetical protein